MSLFYRKSPVFCRLFQINEDTGEIRTSQALDREAAKTHQLYVTATDMAADPRTAVANVTIVVEDVDDVTPVFSQSSYEASVPENRGNFEVVTVEVRFAEKRLTFHS